MKSSRRKMVKGDERGGRKVGGEGREGGRLKRTDGTQEARWIEGGGRLDARRRASTGSATRRHGAKGDHRRKGTREGT